MKTIFCLISAASLLAFNGPASPLPRSAPEEQGISSAELRQFVEALDQQVDAMHSLMLVRHGRVIVEAWWTPYDAQTPHALFSLSKSFTSTAVGLATAEGKFSLDDPVLKFFPDETPGEPSANLKAMRVRDLLRMATGHQTEPAVSKADNWAQAFLAQPVPHKPGTHFLYNTAATYMLSAIVQKTTGETVLDFLRPRLFDPLGIENPQWGTSPQGVSLGGYGLSIRTEDIARFGQLYLQNGEWEGRQLVPREWVAEAMARQVANGSRPESDWDQGYGYQFWRCRHGAYRGDGAFGQFCVVMPEQDAVVAITSGTRDMQRVLNIIWNRLLPAMRYAPLPKDEDAHARLTDFLGGLTLPRPQASGSMASASCSGRKYIFPSNSDKLEWLSLDFRDESAEPTLTIQAGGAEQKITPGRSSWTKGRFAYRGNAEQPVAASGAWTGEGVYTAKIAFVETPFVLTVNLKFSGDEVTCNTEFNVAFGPTKGPELIGRAQP